MTDQFITFTICAIALIELGVIFAYEYALKQQRETVRDLQRANRILRNVKNHGRSLNSIANHLDIRLGDSYSPRIAGNR